MKYLILSTLCLAACGMTTPELHIPVACNPDVPDCTLALADVDAAANTAAALFDAVGVFAGHFVAVTFSNGPIETWGDKYFGCTTTDGGEALIQTMYPTGGHSVAILGPCMFEDDSALLHEFAHAVLYLSTGSPDNDHTNIKWHDVDGLRESLKAKNCIQ